MCIRDSAAAPRPVRDRQARPNLNAFCGPLLGHSRRTYPLWRPPPTRLEVHPRFPRVLLPRVEGAPRPECRIRVRLSRGFGWPRQLRVDVRRRSRRYSGGHDGGPGHGRVGRPRGAGASAPAQARSRLHGRRHVHRGHEARRRDQARHRDVPARRSSLPALRHGTGQVEDVPALPPRRERGRRARRVQRVLVQALP